MEEEEEEEKVVVEKKKKEEEEEEEREIVEWKCSIPEGIQREKEGGHKERNLV